MAPCCIKKTGIKDHCPHTGFDKILIFGKLLHIAQRQ